MAMSWRRMLVASVLSPYCLIKFLLGPKARILSSPLPSRANLHRLIRHHTEPSRPQPQQSGRSLIPSSIRIIRSLGCCPDRHFQVAVAAVFKSVPQPRLRGHRTHGTFCGNRPQRRSRTLSVPISGTSQQHRDTNSYTRVFGAAYL